MDAVVIEQFGDASALQWMAKADIACDCGAALVLRSARKRPSARASTSFSISSRATCSPEASMGLRRSAVTSSKTFAMKDAADAHRFIESRKSFGKILLKP